MKKESRELVLRQILGKYLTSVDDKSEVISRENDLSLSCAILLELINEQPEEDYTLDKCFRICHAIAKQYDLYKEMRLIMRSRWKVKSMRQLGLSELRSLVGFMRALERYIWQNGR